MLRRFLYYNFRLLYRISHSVRQRFTANGMLILMVMPIAGIFGLDTRSTLSFQIFAVTLLLLLTASSFAFFYKGKFTIKRYLPDTATAGVPFQYRCQIKNLKTQTQKELLLADELHTAFPSFESLFSSSDPLDKKRNWFDRTIGYPRMVSLVQKKRGGTIPAVKVDHIRGQSELAVDLTLTPLRRGYISFDKTRVIQSDPLGLHQVQTNIENKQKLLILPTLFKTPAVQLEGHRKYQAGGMNKSNLTGDSQEFVSLRDYRPGDPLKAIHWRSYAKLGEPVVKEYQDEYFVRYGLILDTFKDNSITEESFETAISIAASFMANQHKQDVLLDLMFIEDQAYRITAGHGQYNVRYLLEILACITPAEINKLTELEGLLHKHIKECCGFIVVLLSLDKERLALLDLLEKYRIPTMALAVGDDINKLTQQFTCVDIHPIRNDRVQQDLLQISS